MLFHRRVSGLPGKESSPSRKARFRPAMNLPRNTRLSTFTGRKKAYRRRTSVCRRARATAWITQVDMRMMQKILAPGMKHTQEADLGAEMLCVRRDLQQSGRHWCGTRVVDDLLVLESQPREFMRNGEDHMEVATEVVLYCVQRATCRERGQTLRQCRLRQEL